MKGRIITLLGRRDEPTDALEEYCSWLGQGIVPLGYELEAFRMRWADKGWRAAIDELRKRAVAWNGSWVLLQYTALSWSWRGFPSGSLRVLHVLRQCGARCGVVFHDAQPFGGTRMIDRARRSYQRHIMRRLYKRAELVILTVPAEKISWLPMQRTKAVFIPVGANFLAPLRDGVIPAVSGGTKTVAVFGVTGGAQTAVEVRDISYAVKRAMKTVGPLRLVVMGRGSREAEPQLRAEFNDASVKVMTLGLLSSEHLGQTLTSADVLLFVRGHISSRRGSAIAGIACGLPVVGYRGEETTFPVTEAGVLLVPPDDREALAAALAQVLSDSALHHMLAERSRLAQINYFSWPAIAARYAEALQGTSHLQ